jgi:aspartokinase
VGSTETLEIFPLRILRDLTQLIFLRLPTRPGATRPLFDLLERHGITLKFLQEGCAGDFNRDLIICISSESYIEIKPELKEVTTRMQAHNLVVRQPVAVVRILGPHFDIRPGTSGLLFSALEEAGVTVHSNATTITSSLCVIEQDQVETAVRTIARTFDVPEKKK